MNDKPQSVQQRVEEAFVSGKWRGRALGDIRAGQVVYSGQLASYQEPVFRMIQEEADAENRRNKPLTKEEEEKIKELRDQILMQWLRHVTPVFRRADGTIEPIRRRVWTNVSWSGVVPEYTSADRQAMIQRMRGMISPMREMSRMGVQMGNMARGAGISVRGIRDAAVILRGDVNSLRGNCPCPSCQALRFAGAENCTEQIFPKPRPLPTVPDEMPMWIQEAGPVRRPIRRQFGIGGFGSIRDVESGQDRAFRIPDNEFLQSAIEAAERNREMQYDERTWEI